MRRFTWIASLALCAMLLGQLAQRAHAAWPTTPGDDLSAAENWPNDPGYPSQWNFLVSSPPTISANFPPPKLPWVAACMSTVPGR
ncbi:MAG: hypothetical protein IPL79_02455 [Myxococcales bacterium]|nr:hypothetical protein [Myxococcales bacterium]